MAFLTIDHLRVSYEKETPVLQDFSLEIHEGELISFLGPSGCGKTTTLKTIAGFLIPDSGKIVVKGAEYTTLPPHKRNIGLVFQNYALFPHLSIYENIAFGLRMRRVPENEIKTQVLKALQMVDLSGTEQRLPGQLSGGQQQRVGLARAMVINPDLLLLDEPLSNLDAKLRVQMRVEIKRLLASSQITTIYVTHDQEESLVLSDRIVIMNQGRIEQIGTPQEIYTRPKTAFVADFMGFENIFDGQLGELSDRNGDQNCRIRIQDTWIEARRPQHLTLSSLDRLSIAIRPDSLSLVGAEHPAAANVFPGTVLLHTYRGNSAEYLVETAFGRLSVLESELREYQPGDAVYVFGKPEEFVLIKPEEGTA